MTGLNRKTFTALTLILLLGAGKASHAQNTRPQKKQIVKEKLAQNPDSACVSFSPVNESIYMEAMSYSEMLKRAKKRNESFKEKLMPAVVEKERCEASLSQEDA